MHVTLVAGYNQDGPRAGGVRSYVEALAHVLDDAGIPHLTIVSGSSLEIGDDWCSIPVRKQGSSAQVLASLCVNLRALPIPGDSTIHAQRPDDLLPFLIRGVGSSWVCTLHGSPLEGIRESKGPLTYGMYAYLEATLLRRTDRVIFVDKIAAAHYSGRYPWLGGTAAVIPNAVDTKLFRPLDKARERRKWGFTDVTYLYAGRLDAEKRVVQLVKAFRSLGRSGITLVIAGDGPERILVEREAHGAPVRILGSIPRNQMPSLMNAVDAVVLYSSREGLPSALLEALACGVPVIATPVGAVPEIVRSGENGFLVSSESELQKAMGDFAEGKLRFSGSMVESARPYSWNEVGPKILGVYESVHHHS